MELEFEWDEIKRRQNLSKHGVDFLEVTLIFEGDTIEEIDDREDYAEERTIAYGHVAGEVYRVAHVIRYQIIRIIPAQKANRHDRERYYKAVLAR